jgi:hypothetical protein
MKRYKQEKVNLVLDFFIEGICEYLSVRKKDVLSLKRDRILADIRGMAVYLTKKILPESTFMNFANYFGFKTHAAMMHAVKMIEDLQSVDFKIKQTLNHFSEIDFITAILKRYGFDFVSENVFTKQTNAMNLTLKLKDVEKFKCVLKFGDFTIKEIDIFDALIISKSFEDNPIGKIINLLKN